MVEQQIHVKPGSGASRRYVIRFPDEKGDFSQDQEWFETEIDGETRRLRVHDYAELYNNPGLYEALVYEALQCASPQRIVGMLETVLQDWPTKAEDLRVLDLGAGNGIVAEELRKIGAETIVGLDLLPEAAKAAKRDRPDVYDDYVVADLTKLNDEQRQKLEGYKFNCLTTVAALGFGDIPADAFATAFNFVRDDGWMAMTIKEDFLDTADNSGFARLVRAMLGEGVLEVQSHHRYCHRVSVEGERIFYVGIIARKLQDIPELMVRSAIEGGDLKRGNGRVNEVNETATSLIRG